MSYIPFLRPGKVNSSLKSLTHVLVSGSGLAIQSNIENMF